MKFILGKKLGMTQIWQGDKVIGVTNIQAGPCPIVQVKNISKDGYVAVQIGYGEKKEKNIKKPQKGHLNKIKIKNQELKINVKNLREFRCLPDEISKIKIGDIIGVNIFEAGDKVKVTAASKGKGFQGVVKRHGFHGQDKTHGNKDQLRMPGSIGSQAPQRVFKGVRMAGRMGGKRVTTSNLKIAGVDNENNILLIQGAVPGARNGLVMISGAGDLKIIKNEENKNEKVVEIEEKDVIEKIEGGKIEEAKN
jgi:large subunit ribosomal protein L3